MNGCGTIAPMPTCGYQGNCIDNQCICNDGWELGTFVVNSQLLCTRFTTLFPLAYKLYTAILVYNLVMLLYGFHLEKKRGLEQLCWFLGFVGFIASTTAAAANPNYELFVSPINTFFFFFATCFFDAAIWLEQRREMVTLDTLRSQLGEQHNLISQRALDKGRQILTILSKLGYLGLFFFDVTFVLRYSCTFELVLAVVNLVQHRLFTPPLIAALENVHEQSTTVKSDSNVVFQTKVDALIKNLKNAKTQAPVFITSKILFAVLVMIDFALVWIVYVFPILFTFVSVLHGIVLTLKVMNHIKSSRVVHNFQSNRTFSQN